MKKNNKGFSLVELIIVIAIMAVLIGVLAPQFMKYVEQSRRSKDAQAASSLQTAYLADIADMEISSDLGTASAPVKVESSNLPTTISEVPVVSGKETGLDTSFYVYANVADGTCKIYVKVGSDLYDLTIEGDATNKGVDAYKDL